ncbi:hypothetical protein VNO77_42193 [Canavalia gladiata]|uniref:Secreted protein n=1 Tax=Canavalia gladiata TaxID=3824 RepID=A0AAN9K3M7_CANGL
MLSCKLGNGLFSSLLLLTYATNSGAESIFRLELQHCNHRTTTLLNGLEEIFSIYVSLFPRLHFEILLDFRREFVIVKRAAKAYAISPSVFLFLGLEC